MRRILSCTVLLAACGGSGDKGGDKPSGPTCEEVTATSAPAQKALDDALAALDPIDKGSVMDMEIKAQVFTEQAGDDPKRQAEAKAFRDQHATAKAWVEAVDAVAPALAKARATGAAVGAVTEAGGQLAAVASTGAAYLKARQAVIDALLGETVGMAKKNLDDMQHLNPKIKGEQREAIIAQAEQTYARAKASNDEAVADVAATRKRLDAMSAAAAAALDKLSVVAEACLLAP